MPNNTFTFSHTSSLYLFIYLLHTNSVAPLPRLRPYPQHQPNPNSTTSPSLLHPLYALTVYLRHTSSPYSATMHPWYKPWLHDVQWTSYSYTPTNTQSRQIIISSLHRRRPGSGHRGTTDIHIGDVCVCYGRYGKTRPQRFWTTCCRAKCCSH